MLKSGVLGSSIKSAVRPKHDDHNWGWGKS